MIFSFKKNKVASTKTAFSANVTNDLDYSKLIDVSLMKLSRLQEMGKARTERQILLVMDVLQWSLYYKSLNDYGQRKALVVG